MYIVHPCLAFYEVQWTETYNWGSILIVAPLAASSWTFKQHLFREGMYYTTEMQG